MLQKLRNFMTPMVATIALSVLGATALAVSPSIVDRLSDDPQDTVTGSLEELQDSTETTDVIEDVENTDLVVDPLDDLEEQVPTPTATPANEKPNHGHFVSCIARAAKADSTLQGRQKGAIVSAAARQKEAVLPKGADCSAAYSLLKTAALSGTGGTQDPAEQDTETAVKAKQEEKKAEKEVRKEQPRSVAKVEAPKPNQQVQGQGQGGPPADKGGPAASQNGGGRGPKS